MLRDYWQQETKTVALEPGGMLTLEWHQRLFGDHWVFAVGDAIRDVETWVHCDCRSARACMALLVSL